MRPTLASVAITLFAITLAAAAQGAPRVGIACERNDDAAKTRLVDELIALGYDVQDADAEEHEKVGRRSGLSAHFVIGVRRINVRVAQKEGDRYEVREAVIDLGHSRDGNRMGAGLYGRRSAGMTVFQHQHFGDFHSQSLSCGQIDFRVRLSVSHIFGGQRHGKAVEQIEPIQDFLQVAATRGGRDPFSEAASLDPFQQREQARHGGQPINSQLGE